MNRKKLMVIKTDQGTKQGRAPFGLPKLLPDALRKDLSELRLILAYCNSARVNLVRHRK